MTLPAYLQSLTHGIEKGLKAISQPGERLYMADDPDFGVTANPDESVRARHRYRYTKAIRMADKAGGIWLDCACGSGYGSEMISDLTLAAVMGVDKSERAVWYAREHHARDRMQFECWSVEDLLAGVALAGERFDVIVSLETLEHLPQDLQRPWLDWCWSHLKPNRNACLVIACPVGRGGPNPDNPYHLYEPTIEELLDMLPVPIACMDGSLQLESVAYRNTAGQDATQVYVRCEKR